MKTCNCYPSHECAVRLELATYRTPQTADQYSFDIFVTVKLCESLWQQAQLQASPLQRKPKVRIEVPTKRQRIGSSSVRLAIKKLCGRIDKIKAKPLRRLNRTLEDGRLWKAQSSRSKALLKSSDAPLSLEQIFKENAATLTEKTKRVPAVLLGYTVLRLHGTPWL
ncbi:hypothetical protein BO70DRAFT_360453 [Aspergillus heteromorphus CBS 117.55]|uniref:DUF7580 domain-containing protein n=1 Tax=Aspergillus heteromorphus CBS 117.55 TaxID=1448321 RepID=A0A317WK00_9EURO|nr:uncharacterized protein BO70DRAFT_360453 [Aspergillus heteromorphus CBS 117.55]PWY86683.1 hypothetical protein BO70DRAFT_360453 [Aspergillus heteromorphus CBS 117.55]